MANTYTAQLKLRMPAIGDLDWGDEVNDNTEMLESCVAQILKGNQVGSGLVASDGGGLQVDYTAGTVVVNGTEYSISASNKTCTANQKNWLYIDSSGTVQISITAPSGQFAMIAMIDAETSSILRIADMRNLAESLLSLDIDYTPDNYTPDTSESSEIEQHLAGIDNQLGVLHDHRDKIINGNMNIWQRGNIFTSIVSGYFFADRFSWANSNDGVVDISRSQIVPNDNFNYSSKIEVTTADTSINGTTGLQNKIEGYDLLPLVGKTITVGFWVYSNKIGTYCLLFRNGSGDRSYITEISISTADTWEYKTITLDLDYSGGTWDYTNSCGLWMRFMLACDASKLNTADTWHSGNYQATTNQVNFLDSTSNYLYFTGLSLVPGTVAQELNGRFYKTEMSLCQRYYHQETSTTSYHQPFFSGDVTNGEVYYASAKFPVIMNSVPTLIGTYQSGTNFNSATFGVLASDRRIRASCDANGTGKGFFRFTFKAQAEI